MSWVYFRTYCEKRKKKVSLADCSECEHNIRFQYIRGRLDCQFGRLSIPEFAKEYYGKFGPEEVGR